MRQVHPGVSHRCIVGKGRIRRRNAQAPQFLAISGGDEGGARMSTTPRLTKIRLATVWLDGCSGCHMSLLDMDERLVELAEHFDMVYGPLVDAKEFPPEVDVTLVEGAVSSEEDVERAETIRANSKIVVSLGDCAITANVPGMRNPWTTKEVLDRVYIENATLHHGPKPQAPDSVVPKLLAYVRPLHEIIKVDAYVPGCPPSADAIYFAITELIEGRIPELAMRTHFGA